MSKPNPPAGQVSADAAELERLREILVAAHPHIFVGWTIEQMGSEPIGFIGRWHQASWGKRMPLSPQLSGLELGRFVVGLAIYESVILRLQQARDLSTDAWSAAIWGALLVYARVVPEVMALVGYPTIGPLTPGAGEAKALASVERLLPNFGSWWRRHAHRPELADVLMPEAAKQARWLERALRKGRDLACLEARTRHPGSEPPHFEGPWRDCRDDLVQSVLASRTVPNPLVFDSRSEVPVVRAMKPLARAIRTAIRWCYSSSVGAIHLEAEPAVAAAGGAPAGPPLDALQRLQKLSDLARLSEREREMLQLTSEMALEERDLWGRKHQRLLAHRGFNISHVGLQKMGRRVCRKLRGVI